MKLFQVLVHKQVEQKECMKTVCLLTELKFQQFCISFPRNKLGGKNYKHVYCSLCCKFLQFTMKFIFNDCLHSDRRNITDFQGMAELSRFTETSVQHSSVFLSSYGRPAHAAQSDRRINLLYLIVASWTRRGFIWLMLEIPDTVL